MTGPVRRSLSPSPVFLALVAGFAVAGWLAWIDAGQWTVFVFVVTGWLVSLCLHEFAHAVTAYWGGDRSVADKGYLTLDPRHYAEPGMSLLLPMLFVLMGGIGLPGGAVWINRASLRSTRIESAVSLAGPATNVFFALACLAPVPALALTADPSHDPFFSALAFLGFLQVTAAVLNLMPVPGLDGYGAIQPHLSWELQAKLAPVRQWGIFALILLLFLPGPNRAFFDAIDGIVEHLGADPAYWRNGYSLFRFWET